MKLNFIVTVVVRKYDFVFSAKKKIAIELVVSIRFG